MADRNILKQVVQETIRPHRAPLFSKSGPSPTFAQHIATGEQSTNVEDRRGQTYTGQAVPLTSALHISSGPSKDVIDTMIAEAGGNVKGLQAVAATIANRSVKLGLTPAQVVKQRGQYEGYSNPGSASVKAQQDAKIRALAEKAYNDIITGAVPDPTNGGTDFRAASASSGLGKNVVNIGGNVFKLGGALDAINQIAPLPALSTQTAEAYADSPSSVPMPIPRPSPMAQSVPRSILPGLGQLGPEAMNGNLISGTQRSDLQMTPDQQYSLPGQSIVNTSLYDSLTQPRATDQVSNPTVIPRSSFVSEDHPLSNAVQPSGLTSRSVNTLRIDPMTNQVIPAAPQANSSLQQALDRAAALRALSIEGGSINTANPQAGQVALPSGIVPSSIAKGYQQINLANGQSVAGGALPKPSIIPQGQSYAGGSSDYAIPSASGSSSQSKDLSQLQASSPLSVGSAVQPSYKTVQVPQTTQVLNPPYTAWQASQTQPLKAGQAYTSTGSTITQAQADAIRGVPSSSYQVPITPAPAQYIPKTTYMTQTIPVRSPASTALSTMGTVNPASQILPGLGSWFNSTPAGHIAAFAQGQPVQGGILSLLAGSTSPSVYSQLFSGGGTLVPPSPAGQNFLSDRGTSTAGLTAGQAANELMNALAGGNGRNRNSPA